MQTTLFGKVKQKEPFFQNVASDDSAYYVTVEALWQLSTRSDRKLFLAEAQEKWKKTYKEDAKARDTLLETVRERLSKSRARTLPSFVIKATGDASEQGFAQVSANEAHHAESITEIGNETAAREDAGSLDVMLCALGVSIKRLPNTQMNIKRIVFVFREVGGSRTIQTLFGF